MNTLNQKLTEAIDALIPEAGLKKYKDGDLIRFKKDHKHNWLEFKKGDRVRYLGHDKYGTWIQVVAGIDSSSRSNPFQTQVRHEEYFEPVGIEPQLQHVLWAFDREDCPVYALAVNACGRFLWCENENDTWREADYLWDFSKTLYQQTDETKRWLLDLLSDKKEG